MNDFEQLAQDIDSSIYLIRANEVMRWGHEDLYGGLVEMLASGNIGSNYSVHCKISFDTMLKYGPLHERIKHIVPDFVIVDQNRQPVAILDYLGAGHEACHDEVKQAVARKMGMGYLAVSAEWEFTAVKERVFDMLGGTQATQPVAEVHALQELLRRQDFSSVRAA